MRIAVLGTGMVGRTLAPAFADAGHEVVVGTRDPAVTKAREDWALDLPLKAYDGVADGVDVVVNATNGLGSLSALGAVGVGALAGKVLLDVANSLDASQGFPPHLTVDDTDSLAEQIQRAFPDALVAKTLNTCNCRVMARPDRVGDGSSTMFVASDHERARAVARELLEGFGWRDIIEFDQLSMARGMEMWLPLWVRLMGRLGTPDFNLKIMR
ncbi:MAG: NADPH-dependent F420 reductase [Nocardioidaceae bacterium]